MDTAYLHASETEGILAAAFEVSSTLGAGFLEKVYESALLLELRHRGIKAEQEVSYNVHYKGTKVGHYVADLVIEGKVIVELKCVECLASHHTAQCINQLKASGLRVALLINFNRPKLEWKRIVL
ncbi:MAG: GxxExxY protein [Acidobacteria bacterium]|nr:GxxExxY protein [Acidobacteriota bacterium]